MASPRGSHRSAPRTARHELGNPRPFAGTLSSVDPAIAAESPPFGASDAFSATAVIDASTPGQATSLPGRLNYFPVTSMSLILNGSYAIQGNPPSSSIGVQHDPGSHDQFQATGSGLFGAADLGVWHASTFTLVLSDNSGGVLANNALPTGLDINDWAFASVGVTFTDTSSIASPVYVQGTVTAASAMVPEPTTLALLGVGLAGLVVGECRRSR